MAEATLETFAVSSSSSMVSLSLIPLASVHSAYRMCSSAKLGGPQDQGLASSRQSSPACAIPPLHGWSQRQHTSSRRAAPLRSHSTRSFRHIWQGGAWMQPCVRGVGVLGCGLSACQSDSPSMCDTRLNQYCIYILPTGSAHCLSTIYRLKLFYLYLTIRMSRIKPAFNIYYACLPHACKNSQT